MYNKKCGSKPHAFIRYFVYNLRMNFWKSKEFLNFYFIIQCIIAVIGFAILVFFTVFIPLMIIYQEYKYSLSSNILIITIGIFIIATLQIYFITTLISVFSTLKLLKNKSLNKIQLSAIKIFPIMTVVLLLIWSMMIFL